MSEDSIIRRGIKSYVKREGRMTERQKQALDELWPKYGIDYQAQQIDLDIYFQRHAPTILDIGVGNGLSTFSYGKQKPENNIIAVEVHRPGVGHLLHEIETQQIKNIRIINHDVNEVLHHQIKDCSLDQVHIFFPDPWPKKKHFKRRLINKNFIELITQKLKPHGLLIIATDWQDYAEWILEVCNENKNLINLSPTNDYSPRPCWRPITKYENRGHNLEHDVWNFVYGLI